MRENRPSGLMRGGKQTVIGFASQSVPSRLLYRLRPPPPRRCLAKPRLDCVSVALGSQHFAQDDNIVASP
jgi:hypothetical protein